MEELQVSPVSSYAAIEAKIAEGTRNRTLAATNMNATSSRAHTIVAINFTQKTVNLEGKSMTKQSVINLVDLAGRYESYVIVIIAWTKCLDIVVSYHLVWSTTFFYLADIIPE